MTQWREKFRRFMVGRYGSDELNQCLVWVFIAILFVRIFIHSGIWYWLGMAVMTLTGIFMYMAAPFMMGILSPDTQVCQLGVRVLRIEAFAEPLFAASIVASGALRGAGDTRLC